MQRRFPARRRATGRRALAAAVAVSAVITIAVISFTGTRLAASVTIALIWIAFGCFAARELRRSSYGVSPEGLTLASGPLARRTPWQRVLMVVPESERVRVLMTDGKESLLIPRDPDALVDALRAYARVGSSASRLDGSSREHRAAQAPPPAQQGSAPGEAAPCPHCNAEAPAGARFCPDCGSPLAETAQRGRTVILSGRLYRLGSFRRRLGAFVIDGFLASLAYQLLAIVLVAGGAPIWGDDRGAIPLDVGLVLIALLAAWISDWIGQTPGKRLVGLRVIRRDGHRPGLVHGLVRAELRLLSAVPLFLGYLWAIWDAGKQTWHDKFASTYVVRADEHFAFGGAPGIAGEPAPRPLVAGRSAAVAFPAAALIAIGTVTAALWAASLPDVQAAGSFGLPPGFRAVHALPPPELLRDASLAQPVQDQGCPGPARRLCLIPLDEAAEADVVALAAYFRETYDIDTYALPPLGLEGRETFPGELVDEEREQLDGHSALELMQRMYPSTIGLGTATVIGVTSYDIASRRVPTYRFMYSARDATLRLVLVSTARLDPTAWGDTADEALRMARVRKIVAREVGLMYYALPYSDDPRSVLQLTLSPLERLDEVDEELPRDRLDAELGERIEGGRTWEGRSATRTRIFELGAGEWEYCGRLVGVSEISREVGFRVSAYDEEGTWLVGRGGYGVSGSIGCVPLASAPGRFYLIVWTSSPDVEWSVRVRRRSLGDQLSVRTLPEWDRYPSAVMPAERTDERIVFTSSGTQATSQFRLPDASWSFCWEVTAAPSDSIEVGPLQFNILFEDEIPVGEQQRIGNAIAGDAGCVLVDGPQPGAYRVVVSAPRQPTWKLTITMFGVDLPRSH